jgi:hypothetical protein
MQKLLSKCFAPIAYRPDPFHRRRFLHDGRPVPIRGKPLRDTQREPALAGLLDTEAPNSVKIFCDFTQVESILPWQSSS